MSDLTTTDPTLYLPAIELRDLACGEPALGYAREDTARRAGAPDDDAVVTYVPASRVTALEAQLAAETARADGLLAERRGPIRDLIAATEADRDAALSKLADVTGERDGILAEVCRLQPDGSPPPGGTVNHAAWCVRTAQEKLAAAEARADGLDEERQRVVMLANRLEADLARVTAERDDLAERAFNLADEAEQAQDCDESQGADCCGECIACRDVTLADTVSQLASARQEAEGLRAQVANEHARCVAVVHAVAQKHRKPDGTRTVEGYGALDAWDTLATAKPALSAPAPVPEATPADEENRGLYGKFRVERRDGSSAPGGKHADCTYFVLDRIHDPFSTPALHAYANACEAKYPALAADLRAGLPLATPAPDALAVLREAGITDKQAQEAIRWCQQALHDDHDYEGVHPATYALAALGGREGT